MTETDYLLPADIPGLVREGSVCCYNGGESIDPPPGSRMVVLWAVGDVEEHLTPNSVQAAFTPEDPADMTDEGVWEVGLDCMSLDLRSETSRAHAAAWILNQSPPRAPEIRAALLSDELRLALWWEPMTDEQIAALKALVMRLAGRG